jgi:ABC-type branched-subunit amino acid transport system substrate-binding protein
MLVQARIWMKAVICALLPIVSLGGSAVAQKVNDVGSSDTEIKIGNIAPYSGPVSNSATIAKTEAAYFKMVNDQGGIYGRKINFISYDDAYSPPKTVEQTRRLVESDGVFAVFNVIGTAGNSAIRKYLNQKGVPQVFVGSGAKKWDDPKNFPWTMGWQPSYQSEAHVYARYLQANHPGKTVGILYQNDDFGNDYLTGFHNAFGAGDKAIVTEVSFDVSSTPTVDSQVLQIKAARPDIFIIITTPKFAAQAIRKIAEIGWKPVTIISSSAASVAATIKPAGIENSQGVLSASYIKDPNDPRWSNDPGMNEWRAFMSRYYPEGDLSDATTAYAYGVAKGLVQALRQCGDTMTRERFIREMANLDTDIGVYLPGIEIRTSPRDFSPIKQLQMMRFKDQTWELFGPLVDGSTNAD